MNTTLRDLMPVSLFSAAPYSRLEHGGYLIRAIKACCLALILAFTWIPFASAAPLVNGGHVSGAISTVGGQDSYTFTATAGENVWLRIADTSNNSFYPQIYLYSPTGAYISHSSDGSVAGLTHTATSTGTYTVVVSDYYGEYTGNYNFYFARIPGANEGGSMGNGSLRLETIDLGDLDSYTFSVTSGATVQLKVTDTSNNSFYPQIYLYGPTGAYIDHSSHGSVANLARTLTTAGTYTMIVSDYYGEYTGNYTLQLTGTGITSSDTPSTGDSDGDVPLPAWALILLGAGLLGAMRRRLGN